MIDDQYSDLRDAINGCIGYRVLEDDDVIQAGDETVRGSGLLGDFPEDWSPVDDGDLRHFIGRKVVDMNDPEHNDEEDVAERMFRRKLPAG